jgi:hypothetical protein
MQNYNANVSDARRFQVASAVSLAMLLETDTSIIQKLLGCNRTSAGLARLVDRRCGAIPDAPDLAQGRLLRMDQGTLLEFARCVGSVRHAQAVLGLLDGERLRDFTASVGHAARDAALRWHDLVSGHPALPESEPLETLVEQEGWRCLRAWCQAQPPAIGTRVWLMLPSGTARNGVEADLAVRVVNVMAGDNA